MSENVLTIRDVARKLNLSITTVSRALDGYPDVAEATRQLVTQTAREMGYVPNQAARQLRRQRADAIGFILPAATGRFSDPFYAEFISGLGDETAAHQVDLLVSTAPPNTPAEMQAYERWLHGRKVAGMVINRVRLQDWRIRYLSEARFPFVTMARSLDELEYASVEVDGRHWFKVLVDHLIELGHRRIAFVGASPDLKIHADRLAGFQDSLQAAGLVVDPGLVVSGDLTAEAGYWATMRLLGQKQAPTAIACIDDMTAIGVLHAAGELGHPVGGRLAAGELAVAGFDGINISEHTRPPLTTVNQPVYHLARRMVAMLLDLVAGIPLAETRVKVDPVLEIRESTGGTSRAAVGIYPLWQDPSAGDSG